MTACVSCGHGFSPGQTPHLEHEIGCVAWRDGQPCRCETVPKHARCCRNCAELAA